MYLLKNNKYKLNIIMAKQISMHIHAIVFIIIPIFLFSGLMVLVAVHCGDCKRNRDMYSNCIKENENVPGKLNMDCNYLVKSNLQSIFVQSIVITVFTIISSFMYFVGIITAVIDLSSNISS